MLAKLDRRWALARPGTAVENVRPLIACGGPWCAGMPATSTARKGTRCTTGRRPADWPGQHSATAVGQTGHRQVMTQQMKAHRRKDMSNDRAYGQRFGR